MGFPAAIFTPMQYGVGASFRLTSPNQDRARFQLRKGSEKFA